MNASLLARLASLFLVVALLAASAPAMASRSPYVRAVSKGRVALHRPNYKQYNANHNRWFFQRW
ncbi:hypothetical protein [Hymenobacter persicinus]|uniref:Uncharacterized protein n=1 Tax=Hymenobacter persicinus TaxID=2025506 RepID=A0A4Q5LB51_9BACT|nr:hypothetical protein [Hymenobacter persicinus]RYU78211.1 hypothetical protein EWM57_14715 [Hymenobacter persicinus]